MFDFDGTLTKKSNEIWTKMWSAIDGLEADKKLYNQYKNKEIDYIEWCKKIEEEFQARNFTQEILFTIGSKIELMDNLEETLKLLKDNGYHLYIVSGGVKSIIYYKLGDLVKYFDGIYACDFVFDGKGNLLEIVPTKYEEEGKKIFIDEYCAKTKTTPKEISFVGNGDNDEYVYMSGCKTICINPTKYTNHRDSKIWHNVICDAKDMRVILEFLI